MIKIGVMGLGNIAQKAFLPILNQFNHKVEWHFYTRNQTTMETLKVQYHWENTYEDFDDFINSGLDACFIHTPTSTHKHFISLFLNKGIHVYVDKPISESYEAALTLSNLAKEKGLLLFTGFNRRYAPMVQRLKAQSKNRIHVRKDRINEKQGVVFSLFDHVIHPLDTALYLLDEPIIDTSYKVIQKENILHQVDVLLYTENSVAHVSCNMQSGTNEEIIEIMGPQGFHSVRNLDHYVIKLKDITTSSSFSDWEPTLNKRGFSAMVNDFIHCVETNAQSTINTPLTSLKSHQIIQALADSTL